jgi:hypothetical protein
MFFGQLYVFLRGPWVILETGAHLEGLSQGMDLAFDDMYG